MGWILIGVLIGALILYLDSRVFKWSEGTDHVMVTVIALMAIPCWPFYLMIAAASGVMFALFFVCVGLIKLVYGDK